MANIGSVVRGHARWLSFFVSVFACGRFVPGPASSVENVTGSLSVPTGLIAETFVTGLSAPTAMEFAPDGRLFVCEQRGTLRIVKNGALLSTPFLTLGVDFEGERGLESVTLDPSFASNGFVYVYYTTSTPTPHNRVSRFVAAGDVAVAGSETVLLDLSPLSTALIHNGGALHFGADGKLYVAVGENATTANAQSMTTLLGKMLRLSPDGTIPSDNPFFATATGSNRAIWALGLRNPFTFAVQPGTGTIFIDDVGNATWEEINRGVAGANYGWPTTEGPTTDARFVAPLYAYGHGTTSTTGCAVTGGTFYNPATATFPASYVGKYFFSDYCGNWVRALDPATGTAADFASGVSAPVDLDVGADGALYVLAHGDGTVARIRASTGQAPQVTTQPQGQRVAVGQPVTFTVTAAGAAPLTYQWQRNGVAIASATGPSFTLAAAAAADSGATFRAVVSNAFGSATSASATLTVVAGSAPTATITAPVAGTTYAAGDPFTYAGTGTDLEDGTLPASAFSWEVVFHHDAHTHPFISPTSGAKGGSFTIPTRGETSANVFYRINLTVTDATGLSATTSRDLMPRTATISLQTSPPGLQVTLDGQPTSTPASVVGVVGVIRALGAPSPQVVGGVNYVFATWSDGGVAIHEIATPAASTTYTATFAPAAANTIPPSGGTVAGTTSGASTRTAACASSTAQAPDVTFSWTPNVSGTARVDTCSAQTRFDTVVYVSAASSGANQLACNDDTTGCATGDGSSTADHHGSRLTFSVTAGQTYYVFVDGFAGSVGGSQGAFALTVSAPSSDAGAPPPPPPPDAGPPPPPPDAGAPPPPDAGGTFAVVPAGGGTVAGTTSGASTSQGSCAATATASAPEAIFKWTPTRSGRATADTCNAQVKFDTVVYVRGGSPGGAELTCSDDVPGCATGDGSQYASQHGSQASFDVVAGQVYYLVVDGYAGSTGGAAGAFALTVTAPP